MWTIQVLGGLAAHGSQRQLTRFRTQRAASLLAYLAFHPAPQPRETLIDLLWPDAEPDVGRHNLSNALSFLRHLLEPPGVPPGTVILADRVSVRLNPAAVTVDAAEFESELRRAREQGLSEDDRLALLQLAVERYQGALLPGYYENWIAPEALRLEGLFLQGVIQLVPLLLQAGKHEQALVYAQRAVAADPLSEEATRCMMQAHSASGQPSQALRAYRQLVQRLVAELNIKPSEALQRLAAQLGQTSTSGISPTVRNAKPSAEERLDLVSTRSDKATRHEGARDLERESPTPPGGRLVGAEFLLRTTSQFFGRKEEIDRLVNMLSTPHTRLVTLTGPGGTGKTRLALEAAARLIESTEATSLAGAPASAVFVPLAAVTESERCFDVMVRSLGITPASKLPPLDQLASVLEARPNTLLILDNFEQLVEEGALFIHQLLGKSAGVKLLVTSRQSLQIGGEREFHLAPLPTSSGIQNPEELLEVPSIALFVDRAQNAQPDFQLTERNAKVVTQLCDHLEGIPLAIELAAARVGVLTPTRILEQAQANRLDFLASRRRDTESRHKTLRATLDWSYALLPEPARSFLAALSVFRGGWTLDAAQAVCSMCAEETLELMTLLQESSLIRVVETKEGLRFTLLETIREYGQEKLLALGEDAAARRRHRDYFADLLRMAEPELMGADQADWMDALQIEHDNLCSAIAWGETGTPNAETHLGLVAPMCRFWEVRGYLSLGRGYLSMALSRTDASAATRERAKALQGAGSLAFRQGDYANARSLNEESLSISRELGDQRCIAQALIGLGSVAHDQGDYGAANTLYEQGLAISRELGDQRGIAHALNNLGAVAYAQGDYDAARTMLHESLPISRELGDKGCIAHSLNNLGAMAYAQGDYGTAMALYEQSLSISRELGDMRGVAFVRDCLGIVAFAQADYDAARALYEQSLANRRELGDKGGIAYALNNLGFVASNQGDYDAARRLYEQSLEIRRELGDNAGIAHSLNYLGGVATDQGDHDAARKLFEQSLRLYRETGHFYIIHVLGNMGRVEREVGDYARAAALYQESLRLRQEMGDTLTIAQSLEDFAALAREQGQYDRAARLLGAAVSLSASPGRPLPVGLEAELQCTIEAAHGAVGNEALAAAWEAGRAMTQEQAVAYALEADRPVT